MIKDTIGSLSAGGTGEGGAEWIPLRATDSSNSKLGTDENLLKLT